MKQSLSVNLAAHFKLLAHPKRLEIATLLRGHALTVGQISQMTALRQAAVSQQLMLLKAGNLVSSQQEGKEIYYSLVPSEFKPLADLLRSLSLKKPVNPSEPTVVDPVCRMVLTPVTASYTHTYAGVRHYFCGRGCHKEYLSDPAHYSS